MVTPRLGAPELVQNQAVPETTVNETFYWLDAASMGGFKVIDRGLSAPPGSPAQGDCYILAGAGSGAWSTGAADDVALYIGTSWEIRTPDDGWEAWVVDEAVKVGFSSGAWGIIGTFTGANYLLLTGGTLSGDLVVPDEAYDTTAWNGSLEVPTKNAVRDKIETLAAGIGGGDLLSTNNLSDVASPAISRTNLGLGNVAVALPLTFNFTAAGDAYFYADVAMTLTQQATVGTGTIAYAKGTTAAPTTFSSTTSPISLQAGAWLKVTASSVTGGVAVHLKRTA